MIDFYFFHNVRVVANDGRGTLIYKPMIQLLLGFCRGAAVFRAAMRLYYHIACLLSGIRYGRGQIILVDYVSNGFKTDKGYRLQQTKLSPRHQIVLGSLGQLVAAVTYAGFGERLLGKSDIFTAHI